MKKAYKIEIKLTDVQKNKIHRTVGVSRFIYNFYIAHNKAVYENEKRFVSGMDFAKWLNNEYVPNNHDKAWIKEVSSKVKKLERKLKREQRKLSRKYESLKIRNKISKGEATRQNVNKQVVQVQKLHQRLTNIRTDYTNKVVSSIIKQKPSHITIEDLNISSMMKNKNLAKAIAQQKFYEFITKLTSIANQNGIEVRKVDRFYPSSKMCSCCGEIKKDLKLSDRIYRCKCGLTIDRDLNASFNLKNAKKYKIA